MYLLWHDALTVVLVDRLQAVYHHFVLGRLALQFHLHIEAQLCLYYKSLTKSNESKKYLLSVSELSTDAMALTCG